MRIEMNNGKIRDDVVMYRNINIHSKQFITFYTYFGEQQTRGSIFPNGFLGWGSIQNIPQNVDF